MKNEKFANKTTEELIRDEKTLKVITTIFGGMLFVLFIMGIFLSFKQGFTALSVVPIALLPILIININNWNAIKKEIKSRTL